MFELEKLVLKPNLSISPFPRDCSPSPTSSFVEKPSLSKGLNVLILVKPAVASPGIEGNTALLTSTLLVITDGKESNRGILPFSAPGTSTPSNPIAV